MKTTAGIAALLAALMSGGCANFAAPASHSRIESGASYWISYDASRRGGVIFAEPGKSPKTSAEPAPDVAMSFVNALKGKLTMPNGASAEGVEAELNATAAALGGRDDVVLLAREALFRLCEAQLNGVLREGDVRPLFEYVFKQVAEIAVVQAENSKNKADAAKSELELLKAKGPNK